jgi:PAS domain-containing protein
MLNRLSLIHLLRALKKRPAVWYGLVLEGAGSGGTCVGLAGGALAGVRAFVVLIAALAPVPLLIAGRKPERGYQDQTGSAELASLDPVWGDAFFKATFENTGIGMSVVDASGKLLRANPAICQLLRYEHAELLGKKLSELKRASLMKYKSSELGAN